MKRLLLVAALVATLVPQVAAAGSNGGGLGLGIIVGEPTGISGKMWMSEGKALQAAVAWSLANNSSMHFHLDYIMHRFDLISVEGGSRLPLYFGVGGRLRLRDNADDDIGVRAPIGLDWMFANSPFDLFVEVVPILDLVPNTDFDINAAIGGRFFF